MQPMTTTQWPGFHPDGGLLLPISQSAWKPAVQHLDIDDIRFQAKGELHITLLNRACGHAMRDVLGEAAVRAAFEALDWTPTRSGDGLWLNKIKQRENDHDIPCASLIECLELPALAKFRQHLAEQSGLQLPQVLPHVTLFTHGDAAGIGLPDLASVQAYQHCAVRLPDIAPRPAPPLSEGLEQAYLATEYYLDGLEQALRIGHAHPRVQGLLAHYGASHALLITADNPFSQAAHPSANALRRDWLAQSMQALGLPMHSARAQASNGDWPDEHGVLVFASTPEHYRRLLRAFEQHAGVYITSNQPSPTLLRHPDHPRALRPVI